MKTNFPDPYIFFLSPYIASSWNFLSFFATNLRTLLKTFKNEIFMILLFFTSFWIILRQYLNKFFNFLFKEESWKTSTFVLFRLVPTKTFGIFTKNSYKARNWKMFEIFDFFVILAVSRGSSTNSKKLYKYFLHETKFKWVN